MILRRHLADFLAERERHGAALPQFIVDELQGYLQCGVLSAGCARFECEDCGMVRVTGLSCKGRGFCPRCCGRRMTERARHLVQKVLPEVRVRQWVLSVPFDLRWRLAFDHPLALELVRVLRGAIEMHYRRLAREAGLSSPQSGSVTVIQRFGSDLRLNVHFHVLYLDGAYGLDANGQRRFFDAPVPSPAEVQKVLERIVRRATVKLAHWQERHEAPDDDEQLALVQTYATSSSARGMDKHGPDDPAPAHERIVVLPTRRKARIGGWDLDAEVAVKAHERDRLEHLCRYLLRPPIALDRLKLLADDLVALELKRPWSDGTTHVTLSARTFLGRLASLVPRPKANTTLYGGVLAPHAKARAGIVPRNSSTQPRHHDASWAALMKHSFGLDVMACPSCKGRLRFVAVLFKPSEIQRLLQHLNLFSDPLPIHPARGPPDYPETLDFP